MHTTITVISTNLTNGFGAQIIHSMQEESFNTGVDLMIYASRSAQGKGGYEYLYEKICVEKKTDAVIIIAYPLAQKYSDMFRDAGIIPVTIDNCFAGIAGVKSDHKEGAKKAINHLLHTGKKKIGIIHGNLWERNSQVERLEGAEEAFAAADREMDRGLLWKVGEYTYKCGAEAFKFMIMNDVEAVFCAAGDHVAQGFIAEARRYGIKIPEQMALVGYDDIEMSREMELTTIKQDLKLMGKYAFDLALKLASGIQGIRKEPQHLILPVELVVRETA